MKRAVLKAVVFVATFLIALVAISGIMNQGNQNMTTEMGPATLPVIRMDKDGYLHNELHGYRMPMDVAYQRDTVTELGEGRELSFIIDTCGASIYGVSADVRSADGSRLIETIDVTDLSVSGGQIRCGLALKDLIERDTEYSLTIRLKTDEREEICYYTRVVWSDRTKVVEKLEFVKRFHEALYSRDRAREENISMYLEPNASGDNSTFHKVDIHSSFYQVTWGDLNVTEVTEPAVRITELANQTGAFVLDYIVSTGEGRDAVYYLTEEFYRVRRIEGAARMYLLDYERTMTQIPDVRGDICANDKILLGIADEDLSFIESDDGNIVVFETADRLFSYNITTNRLAVLFGFYDQTNTDSRALYPHHHIRIWDVDEAGNVRFAVYGYMNRGRHEGQVGIQICYYDGTLNMVEEAAFIPYEKGEAVLEQEMEQLLYLNRDNRLYFFLENIIYCVDLESRSAEELVTITQDGSLQVSGDHRVIVWQEGEDIYHSSRLIAMDLGSGKMKTITAQEGEALMPLGFMNEDIIYGTARLADVETDSVGRVIFPMYQVNICDSDGRILKTSSEDGYYCTGCTVMENQIELARVRRDADGSYQEADAEHIMSNEEVKTGRNRLSVAVVDVYEKYVQIQMKKEIDAKNMQILTPREVAFEGSREIVPEAHEALKRYYVYGAHGVSGIYRKPATAVAKAYEESGIVEDSQGKRVWIRGNRAARNQIRAIGADAADEERSSLAVCLDAILKYEEIDRNCQKLLDEGYDAMEILSDSLEDTDILDLSGCPLDAVLYYVNQDIPVLAVLENGDAVLIVGFNEFNIVVMEPGSGRLYQRGMNDSTQWFAENGNCFITYMRR